jgi:hypothetical protein
MAFSNFIVREEDLALLEEEAEKPAALAKAIRRTTNWSILVWVSNYLTID